MPAPDLFGGARPDPELWTDGEIIILTSTTAFRVHAELLVKHSRVFEGAITTDPVIVCPTPELPDGHHDDNIIRVSDSAWDFKQFLRILYNDLQTDPHTPPTFSEVAAWMRLANKYAAPDLAVHAFTHLLDLFPPTFADWSLARQKAAHGLPPMCTHFHPRAHALEAWHLFTRESNASEMAPYALYVLATRVPAEDLRRRTARADGERADELDADDVRLVVDVKRRLLRDEADLFVRWTERGPSARCASRAVCEAHIAYAHQRMQRDAGSGARSGDLLARPFWFEGWESLCAPCRAGLVSRGEGLKEEWWAKLVEYAGCESDEGSPA